MNKYAAIADYLRALRHYPLPVWGVLSPAAKLGLLRWLAAHGQTYADRLRAHKLISALDEEDLGSYLPYAIDKRRFWAY